MYCLTVKYPASVTYPCRTCLIITFDRSLQKMYVCQSIYHVRIFDMELTPKVEHQPGSVFDFVLELFLHQCIP